MCGSICVGGCFHYEKSEKPSKTLSHIHGKAPISKMKRTKKGLHRPLRLRLIHQFPKKLIGKKVTPLSSSSSKDLVPIGLCKHAGM